jgi:hypothetical protein
MKTSIVISTPSGSSPFVGKGTGVSGRQQLRQAEALLCAVAGPGVRGRLVSRPTVKAATQSANALVTAATVVNGNTVTINGTAMTAARHRASCTVTFASVLDADTITVNGRVFTAKTSPSGQFQFLRGVSDAADALAFVTCLNAVDNTSTETYGLIEATRKAANGVVDLYAILANSTVGNAYTIVTSNGGRLAITNDNSGVFTGGAAATSNQFDYFASNARVAEDLARCIRASGTSLISDHVSASNKQGVVTLASVTTGDYVDIAEVRLYARTGTAAVTTGLMVNEFSINGTDTQDGDSFCLCVNGHPTLSQIVYAVNASGAVTLYERPPSTGQNISLSSSNGTRLAVTGTTNGQLAISAGCFIESILPGVAGNAVTLATSGATLAITLDNSGRLKNGTSTVFTY